MYCTIELCLSVDGLKKKKKNKQVCRGYVVVYILSNVETENTTLLLDW